jgi:SagB-type dehydrogenase family enzyme
MHSCIERFCQLSLKQRYLFYDRHLTTEENTAFFIRVWQDISTAQREKHSQSYSSQETDWLKARLAELGSEPVLELETAIAAFDAMLESFPSLWQSYQEAETKAGELTKTRRAWMKHETPEVFSDQTLGLAAPPSQKAIPEGSLLIVLPAPDQVKLVLPNILSCIANRSSHRKFSDRKLSLAELAYLLWATQGIRKEQKKSGRHYKNVPSGGARQPFESYIAVNAVTELEPGLYRYLPFSNQLLLIRKVDELRDILAGLCFDQKFCGYCAVCLFWAAIPYRMEWRYSYVASKDILIEAGHICQNLYLACESIGAGTCGIAAYDQSGIDALLGLDGADEFVVYLAPVGFPDAED